MAPRDKSDGPFNAPFRDLGKRLRPGKRNDAGNPSPTATKPAGVLSESNNASSATSDAQLVSGPDDDVTIFDRAMSDVRPLEGDRRRRRVAKRAHAAPGRGRADEDREVRAHLEGLASGALPFDITETGEYVEGCVPDFDRRELRRLRAGEMSIRDELDLHRLTTEEARAALDRFILGAVDQRVSCVRVVHGRGLHSREEGPILKEKVLGWLSGRRLGRVVLAFTSARPVDGGTGALYVLLRKRPRS